MADSTLLIKDASGNTQKVATSFDPVSQVHTPKHQSIGGITNAEMRAVPVPVSSNALTNSQLRAEPVAVRGGLTNSELRNAPVEIEGQVSLAGTIPVSGPVTDAQLRAGPIKTLPGVETPLTSGTYELDAGATLGPIAIPMHASAVRLFSDTKFRFAIDGTPVNPAPNTLGVGGIVQANSLREVRLSDNAEELVLISVEQPDSGSDPSPALVDVEFVS